MRESKRFLGLELAGAKNNKTTLAALEYYPKEKKIFLLDLFERIPSAEAQSSDDALLDLIEELRDGAKDGKVTLGVNVPLELPPCFPTTRKNCGDTPAVKWMRQAVKKAQRGNHGGRTPGFTPYTQRPVELFIRYTLLPELPTWAQFEVDETFGGNKAPLTARMHYLKHRIAHPAKVTLIEAWPKLTVALLNEALGLEKRVISQYRQLEQGSHAREIILEKLAQKQGVFIYERDIRKMIHNLACFDAFICAYTALLSDQGRCAKPPRGFPLESGWVQYPG